MGSYHIDGAGLRENHWGAGDAVGRGDVRAWAVGATWHCWDVIGLRHSPNGEGHLPQLLLRVCAGGGRVSAGAAALHASMPTAECCEELMRHSANTQNTATVLISAGHL